MRRMFGGLLHALGVGGCELQAASLGAISLCVGLWIRADTVDQSSGANAERRALFVGLWAPMLSLIGGTVERAED